MLPILDAQVALNKLGYYDGPIEGDAAEVGFRDDLTRFQRDYPACGATDGWYGAKTDAVLAPILEKMRQVAPGTMRSARRWRLTRYYLGNARAHGRGNVPIWADKTHEVLAQVAPSAWVEATLNGSTVLEDGRIASVSGWVDVRLPGTTLFKPVLDIAKRNGWLPEKSGYAGVVLSDDRQFVTKVRTFTVVPPGPKGWPLERGAIECEPWKTVAADLGTLKTHDPSFRDKGGVVPVGTRAFVLELAGVKMPGGGTHDGWVTVNDTGGAIVGAHFDVFTGAEALDKQVKVPPLGHVWFEGIEDRLPYHYGVGI